MSQTYQAVETLHQHKAQLHDSVWVGSGFHLASWSNSRDRVSQCNDHHTLSLYIADGYETYHKTAQGWRNGGGPDRFCLMPMAVESVWDVRADLSFVYLYCTDQHLRTLACQIWDREPAALLLNEKTFAEDPRITDLYRLFLLSCDWHQPANQLMLSSATTLLLTHLVQHYSSVRWALPTVRGGLAPTALRLVQAYIEQHLAEPVTLEQLAAEAGLSAYHFARMFKQSTGLAPHQYLMQQRLARAEQLLRHSRLSLTDIALQCGFSSPSHFSHRFRASFGLPPSRIRD